MTVQKYFYRIGLVIVLVCTCKYSVAIAQQASVPAAAAPTPAAPTAQAQPIGNMNPIQIIQYVGGVACKEYGCSAQISKIMGVATFYQECGARVNCNEHSASYKGSFALDVNQFRTGIATFLPIAQKHDPVLHAALTALLQRGGDGRANHLLSAAAWHGNKARFFKPIEQVFTNPYQRAAVGMMMQLMPAQTEAALRSGNPRSLLTMQLNCGARGAIWALSVNAISLPCGATGADAHNAILNKYSAVKRGVVAALGSVPPLPGSLTSGLGGFASAFNDGAFGTTAGKALPFFGSQNQNGFGGASGSGFGGSGQQGGVLPTSTPTQQASFVPSLFGGTGTQGQGPTALDGEPLAPSDIGPAATISCVSSEGVTRVRWSCISGSSVSRGLATPSDSTFTTRGALAGLVTVTPKALTTYTVQRIKNQQVLAQDSCKLKPATSGSGVSTAKKTVLISAEPEAPDTVRRGSAATITWSTIRATDCSVKGEGLEAEGEDGEKKTRALSRAGTYVYTLTCTDTSGDTVTARTRVEVR